MSERVAVSVLPAPLRLLGRAVAHEAGADSLSLTTGAKTDWFRDPSGGVVADDAPALVMNATGPWMLRARVGAAHAAAFDAGVLVVHVEGRTWAKLCLELSPQGQVMVVSVVTRGESDDCNSVVVDGHEAWLRVSRLGPAFAFHHSRDGRRWDMIRYFTLGDVGDEVEVGFLAQSPTGDGCTATFAEIAFVPELLADVRSGV